MATPEAKLPRLQKAMLLLLGITLGYRPVRWLVHVSYFMAIILAFVLGFESKRWWP